ncbi:165_t:CDS:2 [Diversispora eburnea]|uniref:165_t:CDS:1 n=1 Tax=Diversispora eburnea TaxID=1213867 RepID=A0A9N9C5V9_9GLOM|nr:165_t:CDS:2 [Diversispora eburnea]
MSSSYSKKYSFKSALKSRLIKEFDFNTFENIAEIIRGGFGTVYHPSTETYYLVLQYAKDGDLRTYLRNNFKSIDWKIKFKLAKDITSGLRCIHKENIAHKDLHLKNILVHEGRLFITDLRLSQSSDTNSKSMAGGVIAYTDLKYLRNQVEFKRNQASDIYSLGILFWELSSGIPPFDNLPSFEMYRKVTSNEREKPINGTPKDYIKIYSNAWKNDPKQWPTINYIFDSLENIKLENISNETNDNQDFQFEAHFDNQSQTSSKDFVSIPPSSNWGEVTDIGKGILSATLMNGKKTVALKSIVFANADLFVSELKQYSRASSHENIIGFYGISQKG